MTRPYGLCYIVDNIMKSENNTPTPPYASVSKVNEMFELLNVRSFSSISPSDLKTRRFSTADAFQVVATLKFLGLLNEDGSKTDKLTKIQLRGEQRTNALKEIVTGAYKLLFSVVPEANMLSRDELHNELMAIYKVSPRIAKTAAPLFLWLCKQAGLDVSEEIIIRDQIPREKNRDITLKQERTSKAVTSNKAVQSPSGIDVGYQYFPVGKIKLLIPNEEKYLSVIMNGGLKEVKTQIEKFINNVENTSEETPAGSGSQAID